MSGGGELPSSQPRRKSSSSSSRSRRGSSGEDFDNRFRRPNYYGTFDMAEDLIEPLLAVLRAMAGGGRGMRRGRRRRRRPQAGPSARRGTHRRSARFPATRSFVLAKLRPGHRRGFFLSARLWRDRRRHARAPLLSGTTLRSAITVDLLAGCQPRVEPGVSGERLRRPFAG
jgi:hypothetical protein